MLTIVGCLLMIVLRIDTRPSSTFFYCMTGLIGLLSIIWLIVGSVLVFGIWPEVRDDIDEHCDRTTYMFSFVLLILAWVALSILTLLGSLFLLTRCLEACDSSDD